jgi:hypothetical protein
MRLDTISARRIVGVTNNQRSAPGRLLPFQNGSFATARKLNEISGSDLADVKLQIDRDGLTFGRTPQMSQARLRVRDSD